MYINITIYSAVDVRFNQIIWRKRFMASPVYPLKCKPYNVGKVLLIWVWLLGVQQYTYLTIGLAN